MPSPARQPARGEGGSVAARSATAACRTPRAVILFLGTVLVGLAADLVSKEVVFRDLLADEAAAGRVRRIRPRHPNATGADILPALDLSRRVCPRVRFTLSVNPGVVFGLRVPRAIVAVTTVLTIGLVLYFFATSGRRAWVVHVALGMIVAGALGNLYDRLFSEVALPGSQPIEVPGGPPLPALEPIRHHVRDFIDCRELYYPWIFNLADVLLVVGVAALLGYWWFVQRDPRTARPP